MKYGTLYALANIVTVYTQPSPKKEYEYDTVLKSEEVGIATGQTFSNSNGKFTQIVRLGEQGFFYVKSDTVAANFELTLDNLLPSATVKADKTQPNRTPWIVGGIAAFIILLIVIVSK